MYERFTNSSERIFNLFERFFYSFERFTNSSERRNIFFYLASLRRRNKQTNFNNIINRFVYEICRFHAALCGLKQPDLSLSTLSFNLKKYFVSFYNEVKTTSLNVTCFITRRDKSGSRQSSCVGRLKCYHLFI